MKKFLSKKFSTEQEGFWAGSFGNNYTIRNSEKKWIASNTAFFSRVLNRAPGIKSVLELGANRGLNLQALKNVLPQATFSAIEINPVAVHELKKLAFINIFKGSIIDFIPKKVYDFVLIKGVLIHINPESLKRVYDVIVKSSKKYICIAEYYNPTPIVVPYRGHDNRLFKRNFAGEIMDRYKNLKLIDYGFVWHRDTIFPQDDLTWFLLSK
jgi:pseudaminic acid biosynthesis-associated methylase